MQSQHQLIRNTQCLTVCLGNARSHWEARIHQRLRCPKAGKLLPTNGEMDMERNHGTYPPDDEPPPEDEPPPRPPLEPPPPRPPPPPPPLRFQSSSCAGASRSACSPGRPKSLSVRGDMATAEAVASPRSVTASKKMLHLIVAGYV